MKMAGMGWLAHTPVLGGLRFPKGLVGADGSPQSVRRTARCPGVCPDQSLAAGEFLREIAQAKKGQSVPARD